MKRGLYVAPFGELSDPAALADVAASAEEDGWDGLFLWDHIWRPADRADRVGDVTVSLAAAAMRTSSMRIGPMIVPLARRRPQKVAREMVALDHLSNGRLTLGVGLGVDTGGELGRFGEEVDDSKRGDLLDEAVELIEDLWSGHNVCHGGAAYKASDVSFLPRPLQRPRIPLWGAMRAGSSARPLRRAARLDGNFPVGAAPDEVRSMLDRVLALRGSLSDFDVAAIERPDAPAEALGRAGVTWLLTGLPESPTLAEAMSVARSPR